MHAIFQKKGKKGQNISKLEQKCTKFENILKKGNLMHATSTRMKQLEYALIIISKIANVWNLNTSIFPNIFQISDIH